MSGETAYHRAESVEHALDLVDAHPDAELLAGGLSLLPSVRAGDTEPNTLIDVGGIDHLTDVEFADSVVRIGALTTYAAVGKHDDLRASATALSEAVDSTADTQIRNRATVGGNLVSAYPVADLSAAAVVVDAVLVVRGRRGERRIGSEEFLDPEGADGLDTGELLTAVEIPLATGSVGSAYEKKPSPTSRYTLVGVAARVRVSEGRVTGARIAANGVRRRTVRLTAVEDALEGETLDGETVEAAARATRTVDRTTMKDDGDASSRFRAHMLEAYTERALHRAAGRAGVPIRD